MFTRRIKVFSEQEDGPNKQYLLIRKGIIKISYNNHKKNHVPGIREVVNNFSLTKGPLPLL